ncbi:hypothetical protein ELUMI_v1c01980 [Williamsoniiplasma luminosum]|uniref:Uncharacterized protein n=1 Tax=Williamsoniiplasma luminosum TaxID=214888 RepID=A0A2K8NWB3_9MOLU|nr:hypothetical protein [Williamsoniiplasma luminosum]ATZ16923.1 hypothetical protein ELUMI_v1c01980 [Williamsoniiplasma luminosum]
MLIKKILGKTINLVVVLSFLAIFGTMLTVLIYGLTGTSTVTPEEAWKYLQDHETVMHAVIITYLCLISICALFFVVKSIMWVFKSRKFIIKSLLLLILLAAIAFGLLVIGIIIYTKVTGAAVNFDNFIEFFKFKEGQILDIASPATILLICGSAVSGLGLIASMVSLFKGGKKEGGKKDKKKNDKDVKIIINQTPQ